MKRKGNTGIWLYSGESRRKGYIIARSEWGTNYEFREDYWLKLPEV